MSLDQSSLKRLRAWKRGVDNLTESLKKLHDAGKEARVGIEAATAADNVEKTRQLAVATGKLDAGMEKLSVAVANVARGQLALVAAVERVNRSLYEQKKRAKQAEDAVEKTGDAVDKVGDEMKETSRESKSLFQQMQHLNHGALAFKESWSDLALFIAQTAAAMVGFVSAIGVATYKASEHASTVQKLSDSFGITTKRAQELLFAFDSLGLDENDVFDVLATSAERFVDAAAGSGEAVEALQLIGVSLNGMHDASPDMMFQRLVEGLRSTESASRATTAAVKLFGDELGNRVAAAARSSENTLETFYALAGASGAILSEDDLSRLRRGKTAFRTFGAVLQGVWLRTSARLVPAFEKFASVIGVLVSDFLRGPGGLLEAADDLGRGLEWLFGWITNYVVIFRRFTRTTSSTTAVLKALGTAVAGMAGIFTLILTGSLLNAIQMITAAVKAFLLASPIALGPILAIVAAIALLALAVDDLVSYFSGGESVFGRWAVESAIVSAGLETTRALLTYIADLLGVDVVKGTKAGELAFLLFQGALRAALGFALAFINGVLSVFAFLLGVFKSLGMLASDFVDHILDPTLQKVDELLGMLGKIPDAIGSGFDAALSFVGLNDDGGGGQYASIRSGAAARSGGVVNNYVEAQVTVPADQLEEAYGGIINQNAQLGSYGGYFR